jgi:hypothetical protein
MFEMSSCAAKVEALSVTNSHCSHPIYDRQISSSCFAMRDRLAQNDWYRLALKPPWPGRANSLISINENIEIGEEVKTVLQH